MSTNTQIPCNAATLRAISDALETLSGSWKLPILLSLSTGPKRFKQLAKAVEGISDKMLSKELKDLEANHLVKRTVYDSFPSSIEYEGTDHLNTLREVMAALRNWGMLHRQEIIGR
jgi:DNA-binding HxlR family transcriptional regulator